MIERPVVDTGAARIVGFKPDVYAATHFPKLPGAATLLTSNVRHPYMYFP